MGSMLGVPSGWKPKPSPGSIRVGGSLLSLANSFTTLAGMGSNSNASKLHATVGEGEGRGVEVSRVSTEEGVSAVVQRKEGGEGPRTTRVVNDPPQEGGSRLGWLGDARVVPGSPVRIALRRRLSGGAQGQLLPRGLAAAGLLLRRLRVVVHGGHKPAAAVHRWPQPRAWGQGAWGEQWKH